jgi:hypothetical protein
MFHEQIKQILNMSFFYSYKRYFLRRLNKMCLNRFWNYFLRWYWENLIHCLKYNFKSDSEARIFVLIFWKFTKLKTSVFSSHPGSTTLWQLKTCEMNNVIQRKSWKLLVVFNSFYLLRRCRSYCKCTVWSNVKWIKKLYPGGSWQRSIIWKPEELKDKLI